MYGLKTKIKILIALCLSCSLAAGCKVDKTLDTNGKNVSDSKNMEQSLPVSEVKPVENKILAPFTGEEVSKEIQSQIAFMAIIENSKDARPQSGLNEADIVYETMAEGGIPRFIAVFQKNSPKIIGPIRSARAYFVDISKEYNLPFAHCGYSEEARAMIEKENLMSLNEFTYGKGYWRDNTRKAPHNLYTSADKLRELTTSKGYVKPSNVKLSFNKAYWNNSSLLSAANVILNLNRYYTTSYTFKDGKYYKTMDGTASNNREDKKNIAVTNIVIQNTNIKLQSDNQHLTINLIGQGDGYVISNGKAVKMKWSKKDINSQTILKDENDKEIFLNPGNTWWHIVDNSNKVEFK
jgi:hypothetical protein